MQEPGVEFVFVSCEVGGVRWGGRGVHERMQKESSYRTEAIIVLSANMNKHDCLLYIHFVLTIYNRFQKIPFLCFPVSVRS